MLRKKLYKYRHTSLAVLATLIFGIAFGIVFNADNTRSISSFQERFESMEMRLNRFVDIQRQDIKKNGEWKGWGQLSNESSFLMSCR